MMADRGTRVMDLCHLAPDRDQARAFFALRAGTTLARRGDMRLGLVPAFAAFALTLALAMVACTSAANKVAPSAAPVSADGYDGDACEAGAEPTAAHCHDMSCGMEYKASCVDGRWECGVLFSECGVCSPMASEAQSLRETCACSPKCDTAGSHYGWYCPPCPDAGPGDAETSTDSAADAHD
jgi:hypothetical protein